MNLILNMILNGFRRLLRENYLVNTRKDHAITRKYLVITRKLYSSDGLCTLLYEYKERLPMYIGPVLKMFLLYQQSSHHNSNM